MHSESQLCHAPSWAPSSVLELRIIDCRPFPPLQPRTTGSCRVTDGEHGEHIKELSDTTQDSMQARKWLIILPKFMCRSNHSKCHPGAASS